jgi:hypothetical protein
MTDSTHRAAIAGESQLEIAHPPIAPVTKGQRPLPARHPMRSGHARCASTVACTQTLDGAGFLHHRVSVHPAFY